jgi:ribosome biogenesis GTPase / thiamine phosphate phosphatase
MNGRVIAIYGPRIVIQSDDRQFEAIASGKLKHDSKGSSLVAVGDYVEFSPGTGKTATLDKIKQRKTMISRPAVEREGMLQVIVANIDRLVIVTSVISPELKPGLIDRFLVIAFKEKLFPVIVINKIDLAEPMEFKEHIETWRGIGSKVICTSAVSGSGIEDLGALLHDGTSVIAGHSGVGKSSLLNRLNPELHIKTSDISKYSGKGVHTTSRVNMFRLFPDGWVVDTPGLKDLGLADVTKKNLHRFFPEFSNFEDSCQFSNCVHVGEPLCGVKMALKEKKIAEFRYQNYLNIYKDLKKDLIVY